MPSASALRAITLDAFGTLLELEDPTARLAAALARRGVERSSGEVRRAFDAEVAHYVPRSHAGRDEASLAHLREECVAIFLHELSASLDPAELVAPFVDALRFRTLPGVPEALDLLAGAGIRLAVVANWDYTLPQHLEGAGLAGRFPTIVTSADAGAPKPDPAPFRLALDRLGVKPSRALHVGDGDVDRDGALAAGLAFEPAPLVTLPGRLGLA